MKRIKSKGACSQVSNVRESIIALVILACVTVIIGAITVNGAENESEAYYINTAQDLWDFATEVNGGNTFEGVTVYLTADIDLRCSENNQWVPIGACYVDGGNIADTTDEKDPFGGVFEGNNHTISGVYIDSESNYVGFFGYNQGTIKNLILKDSYIKSNKAYIGGITAFNKRNYNKLP